MENKKTNLEKKIEEIKLFDQKLKEWIGKKEPGVFKIPDYLKAEVRGEIEIIQKFAELNNGFSPKTYPTQCYYRTNVPGVAYAVSREARIDDEEFDECTEDHRLLSGDGWLRELESLIRGIGGDCYRMQKIHSEMPDGFEWYEAEGIMNRACPHSQGI